MNPALVAALVLLAIHVLVIAFNIFGLVTIPLGGWLGWRFVRIRWWRMFHLVLLGVVALQALLGRACFLTLWQAALEHGSTQPLIARWIDGAIYWNLPIWFFAALYIAVWFYVIALWWLVPPRRSFR